MNILMKKSVLGLIFFFFFAKIKVNSIKIVFF